MLSSSLKRRGYIVMHVNPNWYVPVSDQLFDIEPYAIVIGFSIGAVMALMLARATPFKKLILASMSPLEDSDYDDDMEFLMTKMDRPRAFAIAKDWQEISTSTDMLSTPYVRMVGQYESDMGPADVIVKGAEHFMSSEYRKQIVKIVDNTL